MNQRSGLVLPILHLNGYKMGGPSLFSKQTDNELSDFFGSMGYEPFIVDGRHESMIKALDFAEKIVLYDFSRSICSMADDYSQISKRLDGTGISKH